MWKLSLFLCLILRDTKEAKIIASYMPKGAIVLEGPFSTEEQVSLSGNVDLMIGIRLHALVFSSLMGKPVIGISYDPKITSFLHDWARTYWHNDSFT